MEFRSKEEEVADDMGAVTSTAPLSYASPTSCKRGSPAAEGVRYHECLRNHAAALGGHVVDGCGEFMPHSAGDPLSCAACGCHRSFHRRDPADDDRRLLLLPTSAHLAAPPPPQAPSPRAPLLLPPPHPHKQPPQHSHHLSSPCLHAPSGSGGTTTESSSEERAHGQLSPTPLPRKRFRTRFTPEQKERMLGFAERVGWRIQRQDEALVEHFCTQVGVRRQVLKVWMHNNKHNTRRQQQEQEPRHIQQQQQQ